MSVRKLLWKPSEEWINQSEILKFIEFISEKYGLVIKTYDELYLWSIGHISEFWEATWEYLDIIASESYERLIDDIEKFPGAQWFIGAKLNFAENLLRYNDDQLAFIFQGEDKITKKMTYAQLHQEVARLSQSLKDLGVKPGDVVAAYMPNLIETAVAMLATTSIGAIWSSCGTELGPRAVLDRFEQIDPKIIFTVDGYFYRGKEFDTISKAKKVVESLTSVEEVIVCSYISDHPKIDDIRNSVHWDDFLSDKSDIQINFKQLPFNHPVYIMFSSGTTGKPKCMVQSAGGVLINHLKELKFHTDLKRDDIINYITAPSWMMWNWLMSSLGIGATILLYDGNPFYPDWKTMFSLIEKYGISIFGTSASYIHHLKGLKVSPKEEFNLTSLREISQTASPLSPEGFEYIYTDIKKDLFFNSISGGTDINGCFAAAVPIKPVYSGEIQGPALGMEIKAYNENAEPVLDERAELVCETPTPSMPIYFWGDDEKMSKYKETYFNFYKGLGKNVWRHGDYVVFHSDNGGITFWGRSDSVLKPSGVRIGTSEIYNIIENFPEVDDSLAVGHRLDEDVEILLFVKLKEDYVLNERLKEKMKNTLRARGSPRHVPDIIAEAADLPYTHSDKKVEVAVSKILDGKPIENRNALRNPESLGFFKDFRKKLHKK
ncbi:MAG: acetoacetate--CoA ligase [Promethearchaeia archaeon]